MSKVQMLRVFVNQRLTAAAEEIFGLFERTIAEYEEQLQFSTKEIHRQRKLLDSVFNPEVRLHRAEVQKLVVVKDEVPPEQQEWSSSLDQEDPEPPHIKEEQKELWSSQEGEQLQGLEEADIIKFTFTPIPVKIEEEDEETPQSSQLHQRQSEQMETEADGEDCGGPEPDGNSDPGTHEKYSHSCEPDTDGSRDWEEPKSALNPLQNNKVPVSVMECNIVKTSFVLKGNLQKHTGLQTRENPFTCSVCKADFLSSNSLVKHMKIHSGEKPVSSVSNKRLTQHSDLSQQVPVHTGKKSVTCSVCSKTFAHRSYLSQHLNIHTGEKPYCCSVCNKRFAQRRNLRKHLTIHTGEKPFSCAFCGKRFAHRCYMKQHLTVHTGEKRFSCSVCDKRFSQHRNLKRHLIIHTREKPFSCSVCGQQFTQPESVTQHKCVGERPGINEVFFQQD